MFCFNDTCVTSVEFDPAIFPFGLWHESFDPIWVITLNWPFGPKGWCPSLPQPLLFSLSSVKACLFVSPFRNHWVGGHYRAQPVWLSNSCSLLTRDPELTLYDKSSFLPKQKCAHGNPALFFLNRKSLFYQDCKLYMLLRPETLFRSHQQFTYQRSHRINSEFKINYEVSVFENWKTKEQYDTKTFVTLCTDHWSSRCSLDHLNMNISFFINLQLMHLFVRNLAQFPPVSAPFLQLFGGLCRCKGGPSVFGCSLLEDLFREKHWHWPWETSIRLFVSVQP